MKKIWIAAGIIGMTMGAVVSAHAQDSSVTKPMGMQMGGMMKDRMMGGGMPVMVDDRESAGIPEQMKARQKAKMRINLETVQGIIDAIAAGDFDQASKTATEHLTMNKSKEMQMKKICKGVNPDFKAMGKSFHASGAHLAEVLKQGDTKKSLMALSNTMNYCISCHASYRQ